MKPRELVERWIVAFNNGDAELISEYYAEEAINHQVAQSPVEGKPQSRKCLEESYPRLI